MERIDKEARFWLDRFSGEWVKTGFPCDYESPAGEKPRLDSLHFDLSPDLCNRLMKLMNDSDPHLHMILMAGVVLLLNKFTGHDDITVGAPIYSRDTEGDFINTVLPLRCRINRSMTFKDLLLQVRQAVIDADDNKNYPLEALLFDLNLSFSDHDFPLFDVAVMLANVHRKEDILPFDPNVIFTFSRSNGRVTLDIDYNSARYDPTTVEKFFPLYSNLLTGALARLDRKIGEIEMFSQRERKKLLGQFNGPLSPFPADRTIHRLFESRVKKGPHHVALVAEDRHTGGETALTYSHLNERADRLARYLRRRGVEPGVATAVMLEPSVAMVTALLGILKAGGVYLPIDPLMPRQRVLSILKESAAPLLITDRRSSAGKFYTALLGLDEGRLKPHVTGSRKQIPNLDDLPLPDRSLVDYETYSRYIGQVMVKNTIALQTGRGCPYDCAYCSKIWGRRHVFRSAADIFAEMKMYYDIGVRRFSIFDDIFNVDLQNGRSLFRLIIENGLDVQLFFPNGLRGDRLNREYIDLSVDAGLTATALALETASPRLQKLIRKNLDLDEFRANAEYFCEKYPQVILELFTIHGFPGETREEARSTLDFIKSLKWIHFPYIFNLKIYPRTPMAKLAMEHGVSEDDIFRSEDLAFHDISPTSPFTREFTTRYQGEFINDYFLSKERLQHVLPHQMRVMTRNELLQKYDSYFPAELKRFEDLLDFLDIKDDEPAGEAFLEEGAFRVNDLNRKIAARFPQPEPAVDALKVLLLDLSQHFTGEADPRYDVVEPPLGAIYVMTYLQRQFGNKINGRIAKSRIDFDSLAGLKALLDDFQPSVIGIRSLTFYRDLFHAAVGAIRQWGFSGPIIAGGPYATRSGDTLLQDRNVDLLVGGEGEVTFGDLIGRIMRNNGSLPPEPVLRQIEGIAFIPAAEREKGRYGREIVQVDELPAASCTSSKPLPRTDSSSLPAYIIYTSGSTGRPKGVVVEHRNVVNVLTWFGRQYRLDRDTRVLQMTNFTFDPSVEQIFGTLLGGAVLYLADKELITDREAVTAFIDRHRVHIINAVPGLLQELLGNSDKLESLRTVISGGDRLPEAVKNRLREKGYSLHNHYGPTETTIEATAEECSREPVSLGTPIANTVCYVLDKQRRPVPAGVRGELYIGGAGVARGYLNNPEQTARRFVTNPFADGSPVPAQRLYRTGDFVKQRSDGKIEFRGRQDHQVKVRGFRVELEEIEARLWQHPAVGEAVVVARTDKEGNPYLAAYYVIRRQERIDKVRDSELRSFLESALPPYMIPKHLICLQNLPLSSSGKVDRRALAALAEPETAEKDSPESPAGEVERTMVRIWQEVLGREAIGINENFFTLGGDSIKAIQIVSRMKKAGYKIKMGDIFRNPVIASLASKAGEVQGVREQAPVTGQVPLVPSQVEFFRRIKTDPHHYNQAIMLYSGEGFAEDAVAAVFRKIQAHHDALRMSYRMDNGITQTNHGTDYPFSLEVFDYRGREKAAALLAEKADDIQGSLELDRGPLLKLGLFHLQDGDRLLIVIHHLVTDGISWRILFDDIAGLYLQYRRKEPLTLPEKSHSFKTWAHRLAQYAGSEACLEELPYWRRIESIGLPGIEKDFPEGENRVADAVTRSFRLAADETASLMGRANEPFGTEINDLLLAALASSIRRTWGYEAIGIALEGHGREEIFPQLDIHRTVGWFTSVCPVRLDAAHEADLSRHIKETKENLRRIPRKGIGYGILRYLTPPEKMRGMELKMNPRISFNYLGEFDAPLAGQSLRVAGESRGALRSPAQEREYELDIIGMTADHQLTLSVTFSLKQFEASTIENWLGRYEEALRRIIAHCLERQVRELTPGDLAYNKLSIDEVERIEALFEEPPLWKN